MPEGPEVEAIRRSLAPRLEGKSLALIRNTALRMRYEPKVELHLKNLGCIQELRRHGKVLAVVCSKPTLLFRLGMSGTLLWREAKMPRPKHAHWTLQLRPTVPDHPSKASCDRRQDQQDAEQRTYLDFVDPRRFGGIEDVESFSTWREHSNLGPDGLHLEEREYPQRIKTMMRSGRSVKAILLDQNWIAGIGNIYASEILFRAHVHPARPGNTLSEHECLSILREIKPMLCKAADHDGTSFATHKTPSGKRGENENYLYVFQRDGDACPRCSEERNSYILRLNQGGRSSYYCSGCQF